MSNLFHQGKLKFMGRTTFIAASVLCLMAVSSKASVIDFEGYAPSGGYTYLSPSYTEYGYTLANDDPGLAAIFDPGSGVGMVGDATASLDWNPITSILLTGPAPFDLDTVDMGLYSLVSGTTDITLTGDIFGGGTESITFSGLSSDTTETIDWTDLESVTFTGDNYSGIDNIDVQASSITPEPGSLSLLLLGLAAVVMGRQRLLARS